MNYGYFDTNNKEYVITRLDKLSRFWKIWKFYFEQRRWSVV